MLPKIFPTLVLCLAAVSSQAQTIAGYKDILIDRDQKIIVHGIICGKIDNIYSMKPAFVYTNTADIEAGTYFFDSAYGKFSYTLKYLRPGKPIVKRGLLKNGETNRSKMAQDVCLLKPMEGLPAAVAKLLSQQVLESNDPNWEATMKKLAVVAGRPVLTQ